LTETNPVLGTAKADEGQSRDRVLSEAELRAVLSALGSDPFSEIVRLLVLSAQRREEIGSLQWSEIDWERNLIILSPARTKNKRLHELPISSQVRAILERQPRRNEWVFGRRWTSWSNARVGLAQRLPEMPNWRLHDLRRTAATIMADRLDVLPHIIEAVLNHVSGSRAGVAGVYVRAKYQDQMRAALQQWGDFIDRLSAQQDMPTHSPNPSTGR
jgi:integrase